MCCAYVWREKLGERTARTMTEKTGESVDSREIEKDKVYSLFSAAKDAAAVHQWRGCEADQGHGVDTELRKHRSLTAPVYRQEEPASSTRPGRMLRAV
jgi:hypothetical protein